MPQQLNETHLENKLITKKGCCIGKYSFEHIMQYIFQISKEERV